MRKFCFLIFVERYVNYVTAYNVSYSYRFVSFAVETLSLRRTPRVSVCRGVDFGDQTSESTVAKNLFCYPKIKRD